MRPLSETPKSAIALPITPAGCAKNRGDPHRGRQFPLPLDEAYGAFYILLAGQ